MKKKCMSKLLGLAVVFAPLAALPVEWLFNFGPPDSIPVEGWTIVSDTPYCAERGWGWESAPDVIRKRDRSPNPVEDTLVGVSPNGVEAVFRIDLEPGLYEVVTSRGDAAHPAHTTVYLNRDAGPWADRGRREAGDFVRATRTVWVRDGILRLRIPPRPERGEPFNMVNWMRVYPVDAARVPTRGNEYGSATDPLVPGFMPEDLIRWIMPLPVELDEVRRVRIPQGETLTINFGPQLENLPAGVLQPVLDLFRAERGYGWLDRSPGITRQRNLHDDPLLDTMVGGDTSALTHQFAIVLDPGRYEVEVGMNDAQFTFNARLFAGPSDTFAINERNVPANRPVIRKETLDLDDGVLAVRIVGSSPFSMLCYLKITPVR